MANVKIWKPGQLVTIDSKVYRVKKDSFGCAMCENVHIEPFLRPCCVCIAHKHPFRPWILEEINPNTAGSSAV